MSLRGIDTMDYGIRRAAEGDLQHLPGVERAAAALFSHEDVPARLQHDVTPVDEFKAAHEAGLLWVAADAGGQPVGFALLVPMDAHIHLEELDVHPDHGRRGLGRRLLEAVFDWARAENIPAITLTTFRHLPWNAPFYARMGFVELEESALSEALRAELDWEAAQGLDRAKRVAMRLKLASS